MFFRTLGLVALSVTLTACQISGTAQKGPFKEGSDVSASQLDDQAMPISTTTLTTQIIGSQGGFAVDNIEWSGWTEMTATGLYFNEYTNDDSTIELTLNAVTLKDRRYDTANINMFTHLAAARFKQRVADGQNLNRAWRDSQTDVRQFFGLVRASGGSRYSRGVEQLDLLQGSGRYRRDNANLLLFTGAFLATSGSAEDLQSLTDDFADDAQFNGVGVNTFNTIAIKAGEDDLLNNLSDNLESNGARNPPNSRDMRSLPSWVNTDVSIDIVAPVITIIGQENVTIVVGTSYIDEGATAVDEVDGEVVATAVNGSDVIDTGTPGTHTVTYSASDIAGNTATATRTVEVVLGDDVTAPELILLGDNPDTVEVDTSEVPAPYQDPGYNATDDRDEVVSVEVIGLEGVNTSVLGQYLVTYIATDAAGNSPDPVERVVNVVDTTIPVITLAGDNPQNMFVGEEYVELGATVTDNYDAELTYNVDLSLLDTEVAGPNTITYTAIDSSGNEALSVERQVIVSELPNVAPEVDAGEDVSVMINTSYTLTGTATDDDQIISLSWTDSEGTELATTASFEYTPITPGDHVLTFSATDNDGAVSTDQVTVTTLLPPPYNIVFFNGVDTYTPPRNLDPALFTQALLGTTSIFDGNGNIVNNAVPTFDIAEVDLTTPGAYTLEFNFIDPYGRTVSKILNVIVQNTTPLAISSSIPVVDENSSNNAITLQAKDSDLGDTLTFTVNGDGPENGSVTNPGVVTPGTNGFRETVIKYTPNPNFVGTDSFAFTVSDGVAETIGTITITVIDKTAPVITIGSNEVEVIQNGDFVDDVSASDNNDGDITANVVTTGSVNTSAIGTYTLTYNVSDAAGNAANPVVRTVNVVEAADEEAPVISIGSEVVNINQYGVFTDDVSASDNKDGNITANIVTTGTVDNETVGAYTLTYNVSDAAGNPADEVTRTVNVIDVTAPFIDIENLIVNLTVGDSFNPSQNVFAGDEVDGDLTSSILITGSVDTSTPGTYILIYSVADAAGNTTEVERTVIVEAENLPPEVNAGVDVEVISGEIVTLAGVASDSDGSVVSYRWHRGTTDFANSLSFDLETDGFEVGASYDFELTVTDNDGESATDSVRVTIINAPTAPSEMVFNFEGPLVIETSDYSTDSEFYAFLETQISILDGEGNPFLSDGEYHFEFYVVDSGPFDPTVPGTSTIEIGFLNDDHDGIYSTVQVIVNESINQEIPELSDTQIDEYLLEINNARSVGRECGIYGFMPAVPNVTWSDKLYKAAYEHSQDMANSNIDSDFIVHEGSGTASDWTGTDLGRASTAADRVATYDYQWASLSENIAAGTVMDTAQEAMDGWLISDGHCRNIMNASVTEVGMAISFNDDAYFDHYWTQNFGKPVGAPQLTSTVNTRITTPTGDVIEGVSILASADSGDVSSLSSSQGTAVVGLVANTEYVFKLDLEGYATQVLPVMTPADGEQINVDFTMIQRGEAQEFFAEFGGVIESDDGASVSVAPNSFETAGGVTVTGPIQVTITPVDISNPSGLAAFPGEFTGIQEGGDETPIISFGTVEYKFTNARGEELQLKSGEEADILIPIYDTSYQDASPIQVGDIIPLWSLNEVTGIWLQEGTGQVVESASSPTGLALSATVTHFTWWNCDVSMEAGKADVTVIGSSSGTATIRAIASEACNIGWRPRIVDMVVNIGETVSDLDIPTACEVCFSADVWLTSGGFARIEEICETTGPSGYVDVELEIPNDGPLDVTANGIDAPQSINAALGFAATRVEFGTKTFESNVTYSIVSGSLPAGLSFNVKNATQAEIIGIPTEVGTFSVVVEGVNYPDGETDNVTINYSVVDPSNASLPIFVNDPIYRVLSFDPNGLDLNPYNVGGESTNWSFTEPGDEGFVISPAGFVTYQGSNPWYDTWEGTVRATNAAGFAETTVSFCTGDCGGTQTPIPGDYAIRVSQIERGYEAGSLPVEFKVSLNQVSLEDIVVDYYTSDYTGNSDAAVAGEDYVSVSSSVVILAGQTSVIIPVEVIDDSLIEADYEYFYFNISSPTARLQYSGAGQDLGSIRNDEEIPIAD